MIMVGSIGPELEGSKMANGELKFIYGDDGSLTICNAKGKEMAVIAPDVLSRAADLVQDYDPNWNVAEFTVARILEVVLERSCLQLRSSRDRGAKS